jgi:predicted HD superfamily hydrolase involved in NAD metabolism
MQKKRHTAAAQAKIVKEYIEAKLDGELLEHTLGCVDMARRLAGRFKVDSEKVAVASYLHDLAKSITRKEQAILAQSMGMSDAEIGSYSPAVLHGPLSALIAGTELGIDDPEVLQAVEAHSTGCGGMCTVTKVVFVADYIEPTRTFPGSAELRERRFATLDEAAAEILKRKLRHLIMQRKIIDPRAIKCWNELAGKTR